MFSDWHSKLPVQYLGNLSVCFTVRMKLQGSKFQIIQTLISYVYVIVAVFIPLGDEAVGSQNIFLGGFRVDADLIHGPVGNRVWLGFNNITASQVGFLKFGDHKDMLEQNFPIAREIEALTGFIDVLHQVFGYLLELLR